ncbi:hypothetical protein AB1L05_26415 [Cytobacillus horneckiae]
MPMQAQLPLEAQLPPEVAGVQEQQMPLQPSFTAPAMHGPCYPCPPCPPCHPGPLFPVSPIMPGSGFPPGGFHHPMGGYPQVQGVSDDSQAQLPLMPSQSQQPLSPTESQMPLQPSYVQGVEDCGCGGPQFAPGQYNQNFMPQAPGYGMPYRGPQPEFFQPQASPYGYGPMGGQPFGMPRGYEESSDFEG